MSSDNIVQRTDALHNLCFKTWARWRAAPSFGYKLSLLAQEPQLPMIPQLSAVARLRVGLWCGLRTTAGLGATGVLIKCLLGL